MTAHRLIGIVLIVLISIFTSFSQSYTLEQFIQLVEKNSKDLQMAQKELEMADAQYKEALSTALPKIFAEGTYNRNLAKMFLFVDFPDVDTGEMTSQKFQLSFNNDFNAMAMIQQTLFSLQIGDALRAASQYEKLTNYVYDYSHQTIITIAKKGYYRALLLKKVWEVKEAAEKNARENFENVEKKFENGLVSEFEMLQAEVNWKNKIPETSQAKRNYEMGMIMLKTFAGIELETPLVLEGNLDSYPVLPDSLGLETVLKQRADYNALLWERNLRKTNVSAQKSEFFPYLTGHFVYNFTSSSDKFDFDRRNSAYFVGVKLNIPIYTGGYTGAQVQKARIDLDKTDIKVLQSQDEVFRSIKNIRLRLREAYSRILSADKTRESAFRAFEIAETSADNGMATQLELADSRVQLELAVLNFYVATYDYLDAYYDWQLAIGQVSGVESIVEKND
ncbi:MAG: TolC family protein [Calditrichia bacterium]